MSRQAFNDMMRSGLLSTLLTVTALSGSAHAENGTGSSGGGTGVIKDGRFVFFDLRDEAQALAEAHPIKKIKAHHGFVTLKIETANVTQFPGYQILQSRSQNNSELFDLLRVAKERASWQKTNAQLRMLNDAYQKADENYRAGELVQVAIHENGVVFLQNQLVDLLSPLNQAGLFVHESLRVLAFIGGATADSEQIQSLTEAVMNNTLNQNQRDILYQWKNKSSVRADVLQYLAGLAEWIKEQNGSDSYVVAVKKVAQVSFGDERVRAAYAAARDMQDKFSLMIGQTTNTDFAQLLMDKITTSMHLIIFLQNKIFESDSAKIKGDLLQIDISSLRAQGIEIKTKSF